jgi:electron transfer flavoprotein beta subunit
MHVVAILRMVPDVVEDLEVSPSGTALEPESVRLILSECDDHALEQALLLRESRDAIVTVLVLDSLDSPETEEVLYTALAKGADAAIRVWHPERSLTTRRMASIFARVIERDPTLKSADLILTGVRTIADLEGPLAPLLARRLGLPHLGPVSRMSPDFSGRSVTAIREYPNGIRGEFEVPLPAVLSIQAAGKPPRYVPVAKVRDLMMTRKLKCIPSPAIDETPVPSIQLIEMRKPRVLEHAEMLTGTHEVVARKLRGALVTRGLAPGV